MESSLASPQTTFVQSARSRYESVILEHEGQRVEDANHLRIGDVFSIVCADIPGSMSSDGFVDENCWLRRNFDLADGADDVDSLFVVYAKENHAARIKYNSTLQHVDSLVGMTDVQKKKMLASLLSDMQNEQMTNESESRRNLGKVVKFGDKVQLKHFKSGKMLIAEQVGKNGSSVAGVKIRRDYDENSWFVFTPRYKSHNLYDPVRYHDSICIAAFAAETFVQVAADKSEDPAHNLLPYDVHEIFSYRDTCNWKLRKHARWDSFGPSFVRGGSVVRLTHKEHDLYVSSIVRGEECELGLEKDELGLMAFSLWRLELEGGETGRQVEYGDNCMLQNLLTGRYLCLSKQGLEMALERNYDARLTLDPVFLTSGLMRWGGCCHIRSREQKAYLHAQHEHDGKRSTLTMIEWLNKGDVFDVLPVSEDVEVACRTMLSLEKALRLYQSLINMKDFQVKVNISTYNHLSTLKVLEDAINNCNVSHHNRSMFWKHLLRNSKVLVLVVELALSIYNLWSSSEHKNGEFESLRSIYFRCHELLQSACYNCFANGKTISSFIRDFDSHLRNPVCTEIVGETIKVIIHENEELIGNTQESDIDQFISTLQTSHDNLPLLLKIFTSYAKCGDKGIIHLQDYISHKLLQDLSKFLIKTHKGDKDMAEVVYQQGKATKTIDLEAVCVSPAYEGVFHLYLVCLELYESLCIGCNHRSRQVINKLVSYDALLSSLEGEKLPLSLLRRFARLMLVLYVQRNPSDYVQLHISTQLLHEIDEALDLPRPTFELDKIFRDFRPLKKCVVNNLLNSAKFGLLNKNNGQEALKDALLYSLSLAELCSELLRLGCFSDYDEMNSSLIPCLLSHLDKRYVPDECADRSDNRVENEIRTTLLRTKLAVCRMLDFVCDLRLKIRLPKLLSVYKVAIPSSRSRSFGPEDVERLEELLRTNHRDEMAKLISYLSLSNGGGGNRLADNLLHLLKFDMKELSLVALKLLFREHSPRLELYRELNNIQILFDPGSISAYKKCKESMRTLHKHRARLLRSLRSSFKTVAIDLEELSDVCRAVASVSDICRPREETAEEVRVSIHNKETVRRSRVHLLIVEVLEASIKWISASTLSYDPREAERGVLEQRFLRLLYLCFRFIDSFCRHAEENQMLLSKHVDLLLVFIGRGLHVTRALSSIFQDNWKLSNEVEEKTIARIIQHIISGSDHKYRKPHYLDFFCSVCLVGGTHVSKNLQYTFKQLCQYGPYKCEGSRSLGGADDRSPDTEEEALLLFRGQGGRRRKVELLANGRSAANLTDKVLHLLSTVHSGSEEKASRVTFTDALEKRSVFHMAYHVKLLNLLIVMLEDPNSELHFQVQSLLPPTKLKEEILSEETLPCAKMHLLRIMRLLYLRNDQPISHPILQENLWDIIQYVQETVRSVSLREFSVLFSPRSFNFSQLFVNDWAPFIKDVLVKEEVMEQTSEDNMTCLSLLVDRIVDILNERALNADRASVLVDIYEIVRSRHVISTAVLTDRAKQHMQVDSSRRRLSDVRVSQEEEEQQQDYNLKDIKDLASELMQGVELFAQAFLQAVDPVGRQETAADGENGRLVLGQDREEMLNLCNSIQLLKETKVNLSSSSSISEEPTMLFQADQAKYMVELLIKNCSGGGDIVEHEMLIALKVLRILTVRWRRAVSDELPPEWLRSEVPSLLVTLMSDKNVSDRLAYCCMEVGIELLQSAGQVFQESFYEVISIMKGAPDFFAELQRRIKRGEREAKEKHSSRRGAREQHRATAGQDGSLHSLVVRAIRMKGGMGESQVKHIMRFLHLLCEGHNLKLQNFLRFQQGSARSVDLVSSAASYVDGVVQYISCRTVEEVQVAMLAIAEFTQSPCRGNQVALVDTRLCACANEILSLNMARTSSKVEEEEEEEYEKNIFKLKAATATVLLALLECVDRSYIPERMLASLNANNLIDNMNLLLRKYNPNRLRTLKSLHDCEKIKLHIPKHFDASFWDIPHTTGESEEDKEAETIAQHYYITYITLAEFDNTGTLQKACTEENIWDLNNLKRKVGVIEISRKGVLERAYFIIPDICQYLTVTSKKRFIYNVKRTNLQSQLTGFTERMEEFYDEMRYQQLLNQHPLLRFFGLSYRVREQAFFFNACLINLVILFFYAYECNGSFDCGDNEDLRTYKVRPVAKECLIALSVVQFLLAITRQWWYVVERGIPRIKQLIQRHSYLPPQNRLLQLLLSLPPDQSDPNYRHRRLKVRPSALQVRKVDFVSVLYLFSDLFFWWITLMSLASLLALVLSSEGRFFFLLIHLLEVFNHSRVLRNVIKSITYRGASLIQTAVLLVIMYYIFGVVGFLLFPEKFRFERANIEGGRRLDPNNNGARCTSIWKCTLVVLDMGLRKGDLGEALHEIPWTVDDPSSPDRYLIVYRMVYTFLFYVMVTTILMNIIFGIIIDTFAELREKKEELDEEITGKCFICGLDRILFDQESRTGTGFEDHIGREHNLWNYLYFFVYLKERDYDDYSGGESYVFSKVLTLVRDPDTHEVLCDKDTGKQLKVAKQKVDLLWFPQRAAIVLGAHGEGKEEELLKKLEDVHQSSAAINHSLSHQLDKVLAATRKRYNQEE